MDATELKSVLVEQKDFLVPIVEQAVQTILEVEMEECLRAGRYERSQERTGYRSGHYHRKLLTRVGTLVLRVPQDRQGHFSTEVFERYQRSEKALVSALAQMYVQGVSTRKVAAITQELCGHEFSASSISAITARLDEQLEQFSQRFEESFLYVVLDARYEKVREGGTIESRAIQIALGIDWEGRRQVLAVEYANRESQSSWRDFLLRLKQRGLKGCSWSATITKGSRTPSRRFCRRPCGNVATSISCATLWTTCRARLMTTACKSCAGCMSGATWMKRGVI